MNRITQQQHSEVILSVWWFCLDVSFLFELNYFAGSAQSDDGQHIACFIAQFI